MTLGKEAALRRVVVTGGSGFIGADLVPRLEAGGSTVLVLDPAPPLRQSTLPSWVDVSVLDPDGLVRTFEDFQPTHVVHLAAETRTDPDMTVADYRVNTEGTTNVLDAVASTPSVERIVVTSSQFVCRPGHVPVDEFDVDPETTYGASKVAAENITRLHGAGAATWTIVRPTTIWGPRDQQYRSSFYALLRRGWYVHPDVGPCVRSYGFVGNATWQIQQILQAPKEDVAERVLYVGDRPFDIREYAEQFVKQLGQGRVRTVPLSLARAGARVGDLLGRVGLRFPITSSRLRFMSTDYPVPIEETFELLGEPPYSLADGVRQTIEWLEGEWWRQ